LMWYNTIPSFVLMDPNMYSMYYSRIKWPNPLISRRNKGYAVGVTQLKPIPLIEQLVQNQYHVKIPTYRLKQLIPITISVFVPQAMIATLPINIHVTMDY
jgi:hypothetical protein